MGFARYASRLGCALVALLGAEALGAWNVQLRADPTATLAIGMGVRVKNAGNVAIQVGVSGGGAWQTLNAGETRVMTNQPGRNQYGQDRAYDPLGVVVRPSAGVQHPFSIPVPPLNGYVSWRLPGGPTIGTQGISWPGGTVEVESGVNFSTFLSFGYADVIISGDSATVEIPPEAIPDPDAGREFEEGALLLDNATGGPVDVPFGDETLRLMPGYNAIPFYGETGPDGLPVAPLGMLGPGGGLGRVEGPDGLPYFVGRLVPGVEGGPPSFGPPPLPGEVFPRGNSASGPTVKLPSGVTEGSDYVGLPPGMTKGNIVPFPANGSGSGSGGTTQLPKGVASGGSNSLPQHVKPSTGNNSGGSGSGSGGGGSNTVGNGGKNTGGGSGVAVQPGKTKDDLGEGAGVGTELGDNMGEAQRVADRVMESVQEGTDKAAGLWDGVGGFWTAPGEGVFSGVDVSWLKWQFAVAGETITIEIKQEWVTLIRQILVWVIKVLFVVQVLKLFMK